MNKVKSQKQASSTEALALADRLHSAAIHLLRHVRRQDAALGEGPARLSALSVLVFGGPTTLGGLASAEQVKPPTMSRIVTGLARSRLIEIEADPNDARRMHIRATARGKKLLLKGRQLRVESFAAQLGRLGQEDLSKLEDGVAVLRKVLESWN
jgi:DNA-binding MarR family transcriptional regulator